MKAFLVTPNERRYLIDAGDRMPLGALYISSSLTQSGIENRVFDLNHYPFKQFLEEVKHEKPDFVGLSYSSSLVVHQLNKVSQLIKPFTGKVIAGGFHVTTRPYEVKADILVLGDGEESIKNFELNGILNQPININAVPIPDRTKLNKENYKFSLEGLCSGVVTSRGCPYSCTFCGNLRKIPRYRDSSNIDEELKQLKEMGYNSVFFYNEGATSNIDHLTTIGNLAFKHGLKYRIESRTKQMNKEIADFLKRTGCVKIAFGIESGDNEVLKRNNKMEDTSDAENAIKLTRMAGIASKGYFMFGLPYQDINSAQRTIYFAQRLKELGLNEADFYPLTPYPGSKIGDNPNRYGVRILTKDYRKYTHGSREVDPVISTEWITKEQIKMMTEKARRIWKS
jgi:anaerobic magnesium-protoporphyrin IX monomethyl ester cyclase